MGGKSSSSSANESTQTTTTTTGSATGTVGDVYQGQTVNLTTQFPTEAVAVFDKLIALSGQAIQAAVDAGGKSLDVVSQFGTDVKAPDVAIAKTSSNTIGYTIAAVAVVGAALIFKGK